MIHNLAKYPAERRESSIMLGITGWLGMQQRYPQACLLISWLTAFPLGKEFPFNSTVYICEAEQAVEALLWSLEDHFSD